MGPNNTLSWALIIATYNRHDILIKCVGRALQQTYPPSEVIIIDASSNWQRTKEALASNAVSYPDVQLIYEPAQIRSSTIQRNQGIDLSRSDIVFLFDDDSLMHLDCAEHIMKVYEADRFGKVVGVRANSVEDLPSIRDKDGAYTTGVDSVALKVTGKRKWRFFSKISFVKILTSKLLMMNIHEMFVPYHGDFPSLDDSFIPSGCKKCDVSPCHLFPGFAMTYRRKIIKKVRFDSLLQAYAAAEDLDASYRASLEGSLLMAHKAKLKHCTVAGGRINRFICALFLVTNNAIFLRKHSSDLQRDKSKYHVWIVRRCIAEFLKDVLSLRWPLPQFRGSVYGAMVSRRVFKMNVSELVDWYPSFQQQVLSKFS